MNITSQIHNLKFLLFQLCNPVKRQYSISYNKAVRGYISFDEDNNNYFFLLKICKIKTLVFISFVYKRKKKKKRKRKWNDNGEQFTWISSSDYNILHILSLYTTF